MKNKNWNILKTTLGKRCKHGKVLTCNECNSVFFVSKTSDPLNLKELKRLARSMGGEYEK